MFATKKPEPWAGPQYEYRLVQWQRGASFDGVRALNDQGKNGWQAVTVNDGFAYMMRVIQKEGQPADQAT